MRSLRRNGKVKSTTAYTNLIITMLLGGLWHGAAWTFVIWGALHGVALAITRAIERTTWGRRWQQITSPWLTILSVLFTFHFVCFTWIFFRAASFTQAYAILKQLATFSFEHANLGSAVLIILVLGLLAHWLPAGWLARLRNAFTAMPAPVQATIMVIVGVALYKVASSSVVPFIYFQF